jgi:MscS family membrane protein
MPYARPVPLKNLRGIIGTNAGWMIPYGWIEAMPASIRAPIAGQPGWRWLGLALLLIVFVLFLSIAHRVSRSGNERRPLLQALAKLATPVLILLAMPAIAHLALVQLNFLGSVANPIKVTSEGIVYLAGAWMALGLASVVAEAIIASPHIAPQSIDAHLIRVSARLVGTIAGAALIAIGADQVGVPVYGIVAGLGVGGLAIALAARPTIENLIGGMNLFADRPVRVGDVCKYGDTIGTVEAIGIRSARIRGADRTLTTIPNGMLATMPIVNLTQRDQFLIQTVIGLRYETTPEQLRYVLVKLRELLLGHPRVNPDPARARFIGLGASSLDIELFAYVMTKDWGEFLGIREDILLRVMEIVGQSGSALALPSQTMYLGRDRGTDENKTHAAEASVQEWRDEGSLPFPNFSPEQADLLARQVGHPVDVVTGADHHATALVDMGRAQEARAADVGVHVDRREQAADAEQVVEVVDVMRVPVVQGGGAEIGVLDADLLELFAHPAERLVDIAGGHDRAVRVPGLFPVQGCRAGVRRRGLTLAAHDRVTPRQNVSRCSRPSRLRAVPRLFQSRPASSAMSRIAATTPSSMLLRPQT